MATHTRPPELSAADLFRAAETSLREDEVSYRRVLAVTLHIDADEAFHPGASGDLGETLEERVRLLLERHQCSLLDRWGPHPGSHLVTIFGRTNQPDDSARFAARLDRIRADLVVAIRDADWRELGAKTGLAIKVVAHVGAMATLFVVTNAVVSTAVLGVPPGVFAVLTFAERSVDLVADTYALFWRNSIGQSLEQSAATQARVESQAAPGRPTATSRATPRLRLSGSST